MIVHLNPPPQPGTALGDPIEVGAQRAVYGKGRSEAQPLVLAATKSNIGHLEGGEWPQMETFNWTSLDPRHSIDDFCLNLGTNSLTKELVDVFFVTVLTVFVERNML